MKMLYLVSLLCLPLVGCNEYPGQATKVATKVVERGNDSIKLTPTPKWGGVAGQDFPIGGDCQIDAINDNPGDRPESHTVKKSESTLRVSGWAAISVKEGVMASDVALSLKGNSDKAARLFATPGKEKRQDVADFFKNSASIDTGFKSSIDLSDVAPGEYTLEIIQNKDGKSFKCQYTARIIIE